MFALQLPVGEGNVFTKDLSVGFDNQFVSLLEPLVYGDVLVSLDSVGKLLPGFVLGGHE